MNSVSRSNTPVNRVDEENLRFIDRHNLLCAHAPALGLKPAWAWQVSVTWNLECRIRRGERDASGRTLTLTWSLIADTLGMSASTVRENYYKMRSLGLAQADEQGGRCLAFGMFAPLDRRLLSIQKGFQIPDTLPIPVTQAQDPDTLGAEILTPRVTETPLARNTREYIQRESEKSFIKNREEAPLAPAAPQPMLFPKRLMEELEQIALESQVAAAEWASVLSEFFDEYPGADWAAEVESYRIGFARNGRLLPGYQNDPNKRADPLGTFRKHLRNHRMYCQTHNPDRYRQPQRPERPTTVYRSAVLDNKRPASHAELIAQYDAELEQVQDPKLREKLLRVRASICKQSDVNETK